MKVMIGNFIHKIDKNMTGFKAFKDRLIAIWREHCMVKAVAFLNLSLRKPVWFKNINKHTLAVYILLAIATHE